MASKGEAMKSIIALLALLFVTTVAHAQNLSGPYIGGYLGGASGDARWDLANGNRVEHSVSGGLIGVQGGYNWHRGQWLLGAQADLGVGAVSGSSRCPNPAFECKTDVLSLLTVRGRAGFVMDGVAVYATAGIASSGIQTTVENNANSTEDDLQGHGGWVAGLGVTGLATRRILWQAEFLRLSFGSEEHVMAGVRQQVKAAFDMFRVGVHYKFY
jgi:outer membrane immunogenic protein